LKEKFIIYQVIPRLFGNINRNCVPDGSYHVNGSGKFSAFDKNILKSIRELGCSYIWMTGVLEHATTTTFPGIGLEGEDLCIVKGKAGSPYAIKDYYDVSPELAEVPALRKEEFSELITRAKQEHLKIIIDFVPNHLSRAYFSDSKPDGVEDFGSRDNFSCSFDPQNNFYYIPGEAFISPHKGGCKRFVESPAKATGNDCFLANPSVNDWYETVKLNYGVDYINSGNKYFNPVPDTWNKMIDILLHWCGKGVGGFRCDMAEMVPPEFWQMALKTVKNRYPEVIFIAEIYNRDLYRVFTDAGFDYLYDKSGLYDTLRMVLSGIAPASAITGCWQRVEGIGNKMLNFMENHDEQRIASDFFLGDPFCVLPALVVSLLMSNSPFLIYFGQELGERGMDSEGFSTIDGKTSIFDYWSLSSIREWIGSGIDPEIRRLYKRILNLSISEPSLSRGKFYDLEYANISNPFYDTTRQYSFLRGETGEVILVISNFSADPESVKVNIPAEAFSYFGVTPRNNLQGEDLLSGETIELTDSSGEFIKFTIKGSGARIIKLLL